MSKKTLSTDELLRKTYTDFDSGNYSDRATIDDGDFSDIIGSFTDDIREKLNIQNIAPDSPIKNAFLQPYKNFNRFYTIFNENELGNLTSYVFITRPDCNISLADQKKSNYNADPYWVNAGANKNMVYLLTSDTVSQDHDFISFLTDRTESFQVPDQNLKQFNTAQPLSGWTLNYAGNSNESMSGGTLDITFRDDVNLRVTKLIENWVTYIDKVVKGEITPKTNYIWYKIFDYMSSIYYFVCDPTASQILFYSKFTGVFPINAPLSAWSHNLHGTPDPKINVTFAYSIVEHNSFDVIKDFNCNSHLGAREDCHPANFINTDFVPNYDISDMSMLSIVGAPFVALDSASDRLYLRWKA